MPLPPVPIIIGTALALVGSGYVFKKFIYDPHLAPLLEALLGTHRQISAPSPISQSRAIPVTISSSGTSTARRQSGARLRKRSSRQSSGNYELLDHARSISEDDPHTTDAVVPREERMNDDDPDEAWGRPSAYDLKESVILEKGFSPPPVPSRGNATPVEPLIDLDPMPSQIAPPSGATQEDEIRSIIFNYASTPSTRVSRNSTPTFATPFVPEDTNCNHDASLPSSSASSTSLLRLNALEEASSLLIMSQPQNISRVAPAGPVNQVMNDRARTRDDDALSFSETTTSGRLSDLSGYEDAETYSPRSRVMSPVRAHSLRPASFHQEGDQGGLVEDFEMVYARRGTMSVVSVSESEGEALGEGWRSEGEENEWDGLGLL